MSADEFIYSAINADNVSQLDLNVIANRLANTDSLVRQNKQQREENETLKEKIASLHKSAVQIHKLYQTEMAKNSQHLKEEEKHAREVQALKQHAVAMENAKVNVELCMKERIAELERQLENSKRKCDGLVFDALRHWTPHGEQSSGDVQMRWRDLKQHVSTLKLSGEDIPEDVADCIARGSGRKKRRKKPDDEYRDQGTQTSPVASGKHDAACNTDHPPRQTFCDKSTMHSMSTITRSTCTSAFIKYADVGVNFPEVVPKSIDEILRECIITPPPLLSPILDIPSRISVEVQTDPVTIAEPTDAAAPPLVSSPGHAPETVSPAKVLVTCGTNTALQNIRKRIDYCSTVCEELYLSRLAKIKKEEMLPHFPLQHLLFQQQQEQQLMGEDTSRINPQLTSIWALLGEAMFTLVGNGRIFDRPRFDALNERLAMIKHLIDADERQQQQHQQQQHESLHSLVQKQVEESIGRAGEVGADKCSSGRDMAQTAEPEKQADCEVVPSAIDCAHDVLANEDFVESTDAIVEGQTAELSDDELVSIIPGQEEVCASNEEAKRPATDPDEVDEIANELRMMEEGECLAYDANADRRFCSPPPSEEPQIAPRTPPPQQNVDRGADTYVSPIKVKETNDLVKDQFKTPMQLPISKRKLRTIVGIGEMEQKRSRYESGRVSPTTESLLEDDWDQKLSTIKDYFSLPAGMCTLDDDMSPLSPIIDDENEFEDADDNEESVALEPIGSPKTVQETVAVQQPVLPCFSKELSIDIVYDSPRSPTPEPLIISDSPLSPPPDDLHITSHYRDSPLSPPLERDCPGTMEPTVIPLQHVASLLVGSSCNQQHVNTPIGKTIASYSTQRREDVVRKHSIRDNLQEIDGAPSLTPAIKQYIESDWTIEDVDIAMRHMLNHCQDVHTLAVAFIQSIISYGDSAVNKQCTPPAPYLPPAHQRMVLLVRKLNQYLVTLNRVLLSELDQRLFTLKTNNVPLKTLTALTYLYIGIEGTSGNQYGCSARLFIYKCLYYYGFKGLPLIYQVLRAFPHALPKKGSVNYNSDTIVSTIRTVLMNLNYTERPDLAEIDQYKKRELQSLLKYYYGYQPGTPTYDELLTNLVDKIRANKLRNVGYGLILVAKRKGYDWAKENIIKKHLYPLLNDYLKQLEGAPGRTSAFDERIVTCIYSISSILKTQPCHEDVTGAMQIFTTVLQLSNASKQVQEAAIAGLIKFTRFGYADIFERLCKWNPPYPVSERVKLMLTTFVHRKPDFFWQRLISKEIV